MCMLQVDVLDVLIVGAGPTGLALATQLHRFGVRIRLIDRLRDRARESRALAVQARSLELLQMVQLGEPLVARGMATSGLKPHVEGRAVAQVRLGDGAIGAGDTRFPFILLVSQTETEAILRRSSSVGGTDHRARRRIGSLRRQRRSRPLSHQARRWPSGGGSSTVSRRL